MSRLRLVASAVLVALLAAGCLPAPATKEARDISGLYVVFVAVAAVVALIVLGLITTALIRFRATPGDTELPPQTHGDMRLEAAWTGLPLLIVVGLFALTLGVINTVTAVPASAAVDLRVTAFRWGWTFEYPADNVSMTGLLSPGPEVVLPVGEPVNVTLIGSDVIHSFFVPQFLFKRDAVPGMPNRFSFTIDEPGVYRGQCAEFCGVYHSQMLFTIRAVPPADYRAWLDQQRGASPSLQAQPPVPGTGASAPASPGGSQ